MIFLNNCDRVLISGVTLTNSPMFHLVPQQCRDVKIENCKFLAPAKSPNTDGIDPSGRNFLITDCTFDVGDDCIAIKPQSPYDGSTWRCEDFLITRLHVPARPRHVDRRADARRAARLVVRDCTFDGTDAGIRMKANRGTGGPGGGSALRESDDEEREGADLHHQLLPANPARAAERSGSARSASTTPIWRNIRIRDLTSTNSPEAGRIYGLAEMPVRDVELRDVHIEADTGMKIFRTTGVRFVNSTITARNGKALILDDASVSGMDPDTGR